MTAMDFITDNTNLAYDLSRFDTTERERRAKQRKEDAASRIRMAPQISLSKSGSKLKLVAVVAIFFGALLIVTYFNAKNDDAARMVAQQESLLASAKDDNIMLQNKLDAIANIGYIEKYATEQLGMTKVAPSQKKYIDVNTEDLIEVDTEDPTGFIGSVRNWFGSVLEYLGV